jgi:hypothetical protein
LQQTWDNITALGAGAGNLAGITQRLQYLTTVGSYTGVMPISQVSTLSGYLTNLTTGGAYNAALPISQITNLLGYLTNLNPFGQFTSTAALPNVFGIAPTAILGRSNITDLGTTYTAAQKAGAVGASMTARSGGPLTLSASTNPASPSPYTLSNYFTQTDYASAGITSNPTTAQFTVPTAGWYRVDICYNVGQNFSAIWNIAPVLYRNGAVYKVGHDAISFYTVATGGATVRNIHSSFTVQCAASDYLQAGVQAFNATGTISSVLIADASGAQAYFTITLTNQQVP